MYQSIISAISILLLVISTSLPVYGVSKNRPKLSDIGDIIETAGKPHSEVDNIKRLDSLKMEDTYFHVFSGQSDAGSYRVIIFDNDKQYLGFYDTMEYEPYETDGDEDGRACGVVLKKLDPESRTIWYTRIPFGNKGPWESIRTQWQTNMLDYQDRTVYRFTPAAAYSPPQVTTVSRKWTPKPRMYAPDGRLAMVTEDFIYIQASDGCIMTWNKKYFSGDDKQYINSIKGFSSQRVEQTLNNSRSEGREQSVSAKSAAGENLVANGDFSKGSSKWKGDRKIVYEAPAKQNKVCKLEVDEVDNHTFYQKIKAQGFKHLTLTYRVRKSKDHHSKDLPYGVNFTGEKSKFVSIGYTKGHKLRDDQWTDVEVIMYLYPSREDFSEELMFDSSFGELSFTVQTGYSGYLMFDDIAVVGE